MSLRVGLWVLWTLLPGGLFAATIEGIVSARGKEASGQGQSSGNYESRKFKHAEKVDYSQMRDFIVYLEGDFKEKPTPPSKPVQIVTQKDATFRPDVLPILVGTTVEWPNQDEILHNVFSDSDAAKFDLGLYKDDPKKPSPKVPFDKAGRVDVFCSIHSQMHCVIMVLETPYFAATDKNNRYVIKDVPPGNYKLKAWHDRMPVFSEDIVVTETGTVRKDIVMGIRGLPKP
jgi:plastocyanin